MENCPQLMYNVGIIQNVIDSASKKVIGKRYTHKMRSILMEIMKNEVISFCSTEVKDFKQLKEQVNILVACTIGYLVYGSQLLK